MAKSKKGAKIMNMVYGLGAAVVIIGALFKIMHWPYANPMLIAGLVTEALVFTISAFEPVDDDLDWSLVYPELAGGSTSRVAKKNDVKEVEDSLSKKLDSMLKEAKIDGALMSSLGESIKNFEGAAKNMGPTVDSMASQKKYSEEMTLAAAQMESLNNLYKVQVESASKQAEVNQAVADNAVKLRTEMESLTSNLSSLNGVYGGMLTAMRPGA
ncbi:gliding motility protein GldL [Mesonia sp. K4-1]|jgi:gliding motility-associated protein GldL|uniref:type IX secretion system motor protein PorL/GldL n=1 Tax=Mesonia sp. K4-1 TaxID=2602760 RepID=UPI0011CAE6C9|nr:gliding motility protein GldL [Mesonia sp. K4-1]TXK75696.1 gliding motility protein GldL [Mesonia sp. K4-1]|tara:strand:- start:213 stop:851 length:639 start_codon:yes stop_codon:yes gene_type:complete